jgi:hypothetical protein
MNPANDTVFAKLFPMPKRAKRRARSDSPKRRKPLFASTLLRPEGRSAHWGFEVQCTPEALERFDSGGTIEQVTFTAVYAAGGDIARSKIVHSVSDFDLRSMAIDCCGGRVIETEVNRIKVVSIERDFCLRVRGPFNQARAIRVAFSDVVGSACAPGGLPRR